MMPPLPPLNLNSSASSSARGGEFFGGSGGFTQGDWIGSTGSGEAGMSNKKMLLIAAAGVGIVWLLNRKKTA